jgi:hypothetical protein
VRRREFITMLGSAAMWPLTASAQQPKVKPELSSQVFLFQHIAMGRDGLIADIRIL